MEKQRIEWIDIFKLFGIGAIFCGHLGNETGGLHNFVFLYHVPLFFFASGIFADLLKTESIWEAIKKRFDQIMVPYIFFVMISMIFIILTTDESIYTYMGYGKQFILGIRNQMYASSLWFFSCLFSVSILFELLRKIFKKKILLLVVSILIYFMTIYMLPNRPDVTPSWVFNIDSALHYLIYYVIGYLLHGRLTEEKKVLSVQGKILQLSCEILLAGYAFLVYMNKDILGNLIVQKIPGTGEVYTVIRTILLILFFVVLAKLFVGIGNLHKVGAQTLWLCGNEFVVKRVFGSLMNIAGCQIKITSALSAMICTVIMIWFIYKLLMPFEQKLYQKILEIVRLKNNL